jgi:hypothetical protein
MQNPDDERLRELLEKIHPENSVHFLRRCGWNDQRVPGGRFEYWKKPGKTKSPDNVYTTLEALEEELCQKG